MTLSNTIIVGLKEVLAHKFRSLLTMLGIILGVTSLVGMAAIIKGMENGMKEAMIAMGGADKVSLDDQDLPVEQEDLSDEAVGRIPLGQEVMRTGEQLFSDKGHVQNLETFPLAQINETQDFAVQIKRYCALAGKLADNPDNLKLKQEQKAAAGSEAASAG